eukprot:TRINITY_DN66604_c4_g3_i4.p1 TRINITY_DN66604_c4_g3~~TRINITY_DN66604_c4_g3_i4.p1  ORF type:complete len:211 (-),score=68.42 TRINITY_DN66604_c4_g3_i4:283-915(-)
MWALGLHSPIEWTGRPVLPIFTEYDTACDSHPWQIAKRRYVPDNKCSNTNTDHVCSAGEVPSQEHLHGYPQYGPEAPCPTGSPWPPQRSTEPDPTPPQSPKCDTGCTSPSGTFHGFSFVMGIITTLLIVMLALVVFWRYAGASVDFSRTGRGEKHDDSHEMTPKVVGRRGNRFQRLNDDDDDDDDEERGELSGRQSPSATAAGMTVDSVR